MNRISMRDVTKVDEYFALLPAIVTSTSCLFSMSRRRDEHIRFAVPMSEEIQYALGTRLESSGLQLYKKFGLIIIFVRKYERPKFREINVLYPPVC